MPCYHPLIRTVYYNHPKKKAVDGHYYWDFSIKSAQKFLGERLEDHKNENAWKKDIEHTLIPCGNCIGCRLEYSRQWANRGYLESLNWKNNWFITLTYDENHMTTNEWLEDENGITWTNNGSWNGTLVPKELKTFINTLRKIMNREYGQKDIRYIACGEYGEEKERPHYHLIIFNLNLPPEDFFEPRILGEVDGIKNVYYRSHIIERAWTKGISNISEATWNTIAYTARYITKKVNGEGSDKLYKSKGQEKEFFRASTHPGIGYSYYAKHKEEIYEKDEIIVKNHQGVVACKPPKYFDKLYEKENPKHFAEIKIRRKLHGEKAANVKDLLTSLDRLSQLEIEERSKEESNYKLIREFEKKAGI